MTTAEILRTAITTEFDEKNGFETHTFLVREYNALVANAFKLPCDDRTVGFVVLSTPAVFQKEFKPWLLAEYAGVSRDQLQQSIKDPLDELMQVKAERVRAKLDPSIGASLIIAHDFSMHMPSRRPVVLMPTLGHVAGAAYYYRPDDSPAVATHLASLLGDDRKAIGVSVHPHYGGWFGFRCMFVHPNSVIGDNDKCLRVPRPAERLLHDDMQIAHLLYLFNTEWQKTGWRNAGLADRPARAEYDDEQRAYFDVAPANRWQLIAEWLA